MKILRELELSGCYEIELFRHTDERGVFVKSWHTKELQALGLFFEVREIFWSTSSIGNIRGMHFQVPPYEHSKIVSCQKGLILDVLLDLRRCSATYGFATSLELSGEKGNAAFIPPGIAHGFQSLSEQCQVLYMTSLEHHPNSDKGILWNSFNFSWPLPPTEISYRDHNHPTLMGFNSPF